MAGDRPKLLCVDDEPMILEGLRLHLRKAFDCSSATSGLAGLEAIAGGGPFAVVLSDMRMPGMDGARFLSRVRSLSPDSSRILLTGHADLDAAKAAVNQGQVFRFLSKPCPPEVLLEACTAGLERHRLVRAERELLEQTLRGAVRALTEVLSIASPLAFGRASRLQRRASALAAALQIPDRWQIEIAAMLSQLGWISVPDDVLARAAEGKPLDRADQEMIARVPDVTDSLLASIPRLERVRGMLMLLSRGGSSPGANEADPVITEGAAILRLVSDLDELESRGDTAQFALDTVRGRASYEPRLLEALDEVCHAAGAEEQVREVPLQALEPGMVLGEGLRTRAGLLLVSRGHEVTFTLLKRLAHYPRGTLVEVVRVIVREPKGAPGTRP
jgi:CheY-like chemotaxis protein